MVDCCFLMLEGEAGQVSGVFFSNEGHSTLRLQNGPARVEDRLLLSFIHRVTVYPTNLVPKQARALRFSLGFRVYGDFLKAQSLSILKRFRGWAANGKSFKGFGLVRQHFEG